MTIAWTASNNGAGVASVITAYPAASNGDLLLLFINNKYPAAASPTTPTGFTFGISACGGLNSDGADSGSVIGSVYYKFADGTETGNLTTTITGGNVAHGVLMGLRATSGSYLLDFSSACKSVGTSTSWVACAFGDVGLSANDYLVVMSAMNSDVATVSAQEVSNTGVTMSAVTEINEPSTSQGDDVKSVIATASVVSGTSTGCPVYFMLVSASTAATRPAGVSLFVRIREATAGGIMPGFLQPMGIIW